MKCFYVKFKVVYMSGFESLGQVFCALTASDFSSGKETGWPEASGGRP